MTEHDPLCTAIHKHLILSTICSPCQLVRRVREDMQDFAKSEYHRGYDEGRADERELVFRNAREKSE